MGKKRGVSLNKKLQYDEHGNIIVGTFKENNIMPKYNPYSCGVGVFKDKSSRNRKGKAAQQERNRLRKGEWYE